MGESTKKINGDRKKRNTSTVASPLAFVRPSSLGEMIHERVRRAIEEAVGGARLSAGRSEVRPRR